MDSCTVGVGSLHLGIRTNEPLVGRVIREAFGAILVDDPDAPANFSLFVQKTGENGHRKMHRLYTGHTLTDTSFGLGPLLQVLARQVAACDEALEATQLPHHVAAIGDGGAAIVSALAMRVDALRARLRRAGLQTIGGTLLVDPVSLTLEIPGLPGVNFDLEQVEDRWPSPAGQPGAPHRGSVPIIAWGLAPLPPLREGQEVEANEAIFEGARTASPDRPAQETLDLLAGLAQVARPFVAFQSASKTADRLIDLLGASNRG